MGFKSLYYDYICCFCTKILKRPRHWVEYKKVLNDVNADMKQQMDLVKLVKRMRIQGMLLAMLIPPKTLRIVGSQGETKILDDKKFKKFGF